MKIKCPLLLIMLVISSLVAAQNAAPPFQIKGVLLDSLTQEGEPYATIKIVKKEAPAHALKMLVTDMKGKFQEKVPGTGDFVMTISSIGRNTIVKDFTVKAGEKIVDFGTLYITDASNELGQVEVVAQKPLVKADIDKIEYNVQDDPDSKSNSVLEMLRKVPLVTVDGEDNIKVNGSSSFKVYVNGKPNNMMSNNPTEVLKSMPANSIKHIEVITNPGPKYDAEGVGGILNIVTVGSGLEGYTATFSGNVSNMGAGGGLFGTIKSGKLTISARYNYNYNDRPRSYSGGTRRTVGDITDGSSDLDYSGDSKGHGNFQSGSMEASYEIDTLRLITMSFGLWGGGNNSNGLSNTFATMPGTGDDLYQYVSNNRSKSSWYSIDGGIDYQRMFHVKDRMLTFSYKINTRPESSDSYSTYDYDMEDVAPDWQDFMKRMKNQHNDGSQNTTEHTFQADYTTPIGKIHTLEAGAKYILRDNSSEDDRYEQASATQADYEFDNDHSSHYKHQNDILAAYLGYGLKVKKISGRLGVRYEHTKQEVKYLLGKGDNFDKNFDDLVPSASIGYKLTDMSNLRFGYNMRIYRPGIWYLNPYVNNADPQNISFGNPNLDSEKSNNINLNYSMFAQKFSINASATYTFVNNSIEQYTFIDPKNPGIFQTTYGNIGKKQSTGLFVYANWNPVPLFRIYMNGGVDYTDLKSDMNDMANSGFSGRIFAGTQFNFPMDFRLNLHGGYFSPWIQLQGKRSPFYFTGISVNKDFLKKKLSVQLSFQNPFWKRMKMENTSSDDTFFRRETNYRTMRMLQVSVSYRFGTLKDAIKKVKRGINNDDVKSGGSGGGEQQM